MTSTSDTWTNLALASAHLYQRPAPAPAPLFPYQHPDFEDMSCRWCGSFYNASELGNDEVCSDEHYNFIHLEEILYAFFGTAGEA